MDIRKDDTLRMIDHKTKAEVFVKVEDVDGQKVTVVRFDTGEQIDFNKKGDNDYEQNI